MGTAYDIVFLDGLHAFEQTPRDVCSALLPSQHASAISIQDTAPSDTYLALPDQARALQHRALAGVAGQSWHGDTFKVVFAVHGFHPGLAYHNPWDRQSTNVDMDIQALPRLPRLHSLGAIRRMTYSDAMDAIAVFYDASESEAMGACVDDINGVRDQA